MFIVAVHIANLLKMPPRIEALRHSGLNNLLRTSPTVTLYLGVELRSERRPGTWQKTSSSMALKGGSPLIPSSGSGVDATKIFVINCTYYLNFVCSLAESEDMDETPELGLSCAMPVM